MLTPNVVGLISLARTSYTVDEDSGSFAVCVEVSGPNPHCPVPFPFQLTLSSLRGSAGEVGMFYDGGLVNYHLFLSLQILMWIISNFLKN